MGGPRAREQGFRLRFVPRARVRHLFARSAGAQSRDRAAARGVAAALPRAPVRPARAGAARARGRAAAPPGRRERRSPSRASRRAPGAWLAVSTNPSLIPFAGAPLDDGLPASRRRARVARARGRSTCASSGRRTGGRSRRSSGRSGERLRDPRRRPPPTRRASGVSSSASSRRELSEEEWRWKFAQDPDGWYGVVGVLDGEVVGNYAGWGMRFLLDGEPRLLYSVGDVATDPSVRALGGRRGVYRAMTDAFYEAVGRAGAVLLRLPERARARGQRADRRIAHALSDRARSATPVEAFGPPPPDVGSGEFVGRGFDPLWEAARAPLHARGRARPRARELAVPRAADAATTGWSGGGRARELAAWAALSVVGEEAHGRRLPGPRGRRRATCRRSSPPPPTRPGASARGASSSGRRRAARAAARSRRCPARAPTRASR